MRWTDLKLEKELDRFLTLLEQLDAQETIGVFKLMGIDFKNENAAEGEDQMADGETLYVRAIQKYPKLSKKARKNLLFVMREAVKDNKVTEEGE